MQRRACKGCKGEKQECGGWPPLFLLHSVLFFIQRILTPPPHLSPQKSNTSRPVTARAPPRRCRFPSTPSGRARLCFFLGGPGTARGQGTRMQATRAGLGWVGGHAVRVRPTLDDRGLAASFDAGTERAFPLFLGASRGPCRTCCPGKTIGQHLDTLWGAARQNARRCLRTSSSVV